MSIASNKYTLNDIASKIPETAFTTLPSATGTTSLLDMSQNNFASSPYFAWINSSTQMGITDMCANDMSGNLAKLVKWSDYGNALFDGIGSATTPAGNGKPLGNRYFMPAAARSGIDASQVLTKKCIAPNGDKVDQYYVVDGMAKQPGVDKSGLFFSARATVDNIDSQNITRFYTPVADYTTKGQVCTTVKNKHGRTRKKCNIGTITHTDNIQIQPSNPLLHDMCVNAKITTDSTGATATNYVSKADFADLKARGIATEAFQAHRSSHLPHHQLVRGHSGQWGTELGGGYVIGGDIVFQPQSIVAPMMYTAVETDEDKNYRAWVPETTALTREQSRTMAKKGYDVITGFFIGSITVVGLFIVFQLIDRSPSRIRR